MENHDETKANSNFDLGSILVNSKGFDQPTQPIDSEAGDSEKKRPLNRVKEFRKKCNLSVKELSEQSGVSASTIYTYEKRPVKPAYDKLVSMSRVLGVNPEQLMRLEDEPADLVAEKSAPYLTDQGQEASPDLVRVITEGLSDDKTKDLLIRAASVLTRKDLMLLVKFAETNQFSGFEQHEIHAMVALMIGFRARGA